MKLERIAIYFTKFLPLTIYAAAIHEYYLHSLLTERVRCLFCDYMGIRIVHPIGEDFQGHKLEFEKMVCGEDPCNDGFVPEVMQPFYTNIDIIERSQVTSDRVNGRVEEDCLYSDPNGDSSDGYDSDLTLLSDEFEGDLGSMDDDCPPYCRVTSCSRCC